MSVAIYVLIIVAYFIYKVYKDTQKMKVNSQKKKEQTPTASSSQSSPKSFEELLKEFAEQRTTDTQQSTLSESVQKESERKKPVEEKTLIPTKKVPDTVHKEKKGIEPVKEKQAVLKKTTEPDSVQKDEYLQPYRFHTHKASFYARLLKDPVTLKQAVVLNEVLNRRYF